MRYRLTLISLLLLTTLSACNLGRTEEDQSTAPPNQLTSTPLITGKPAVAIASPQNGAEVVVGDTIFVSANATDTIGITRIQLLANNQIVKTVSSDAVSGETNKSALLDYTPRFAGAVTLQVVAYRGSTASDPAQIQITVRDSQAQVTATAAQDVNVPVIDPNDPTCRVLVNSGLNFRTGPGTNYDIITVLSAGTVLPIVGRVGDNSWWQLSSGTAVGWVSAQFTTTYGVCSNVPVLVPPASPTPKGGPTSTPTPTATPPATNTSVPPTITNTPGLPDLVITSITGPDTVTIVAGQSQVTQSYSVAISNLGFGPTGQFNNTIAVLPGGSDIDLGAVSNLNPGESINLTVNITFTGAGSFTIQAKADSGAKITEVSEVNNGGAISVTVKNG